MTIWHGERPSVTREASGFSIITSPAAGGQ